MVVYQSKSVEQLMCMTVQKVVIKLTAPSDSSTVHMSFCVCYSRTEPKGILSINKNLTGCTDIICLICCTPVIGFYSIA